jgi:glycosyltransferase involved in cell wall biosynthesis
MVDKVSIVIPSLNENDSVEKMVLNINETIGLDEFEIIIVDSGGTETSGVRELPMVQVYNTPREGAPQARNFGATKATNDILLFADAHTQFRPEWGSKLLNDFGLNTRSLITPCVTVMGDDNRRGCGFKWTNISMKIFWLPDLRQEIHEIPFACSCCMAVMKEVFQELGQFDSGTRFWGEEDSEISMRAWLMGYSVLCDPSIRVGHMFRSEHPYNLEWSDMIYNKIRFAISHFNTQRISKHLREMSYSPDFNKLLLMVLEDHVLDRREDLSRRRVHDDNWFFQKFPMEGWSV